MVCKVLICKNTTCSQQGSARVAKAFETQIAQSGRDDIVVQRSGCLGECGSGPMVFVTPEETWYSHVQPSDVPVIVVQHLLGGKVVKHKLYAKYHPKEVNWKGWIAVCVVLLTILGLLFGLLASQSYYI